MEITITPETSKKIERYSNLKKELDILLQVELLPQLRKCVENNNEDGLREMIKLLDDHPFQMRCYQGLVEIKNKKAEL